MSKFTGMDGQYSESLPVIAQKHSCCHHLDRIILLLSLPTRLTKIHLREINVWFKLGFRRSAEPSYQQNATCAPNTSSLLPPINCDRVAFFWACSLLFLLFTRRPTTNHVTWLEIQDGADHFQNGGKLRTLERSFANQKRHKKLWLWFS